MEDTKEKYIENQNIEINYEKMIYNKTIEDMEKTLVYLKNNNKKLKEKIDKTHKNIREILDKY